jgi:small subunit ribosomal protein S18
MTDNTQERDSRGPRQEGDGRPSRFGGPQGQRGDGDSGPRRSGPSGGRRSSGGGGGRYTPRRKVSQFAIDNVEHVDYKDLARLRRHVGERGKIEPRRKMGTSAKHQRSLTVAIKRARYMALLPFTNATERN